VNFFLGPRQATNIEFCVLLRWEMLLTPISGELSGSFDFSLMNLHRHIFTSIIPLSSSLLYWTSILLTFTVLKVRYRLNHFPFSLQSAVSILGKSYCGNSGIISLALIRSRIKTPSRETALLEENPVSRSVSRLLIITDLRSKPISLQFLSPNESEF
jgi:hypothetical protein